MSRGLELGEEHELLEPAIDAGRSLPGDDANFIDLSDGIDFGLNGQRIIEVRTNATKTTQCRIRRAGRLVKTSLFGSDHLPRCRKTSKKNTESEQSQNDAYNGRHRERPKDVIEMGLPSITSVPLPGMREANPSLELKIFRHRAKLRPGHHIPKRNEGLQLPLARLAI